MATTNLTESRGWPWPRLGLAAVLAVAATLNIWGLTRAGYSNQYYAAAVLSMLQNWHNFFFVSFDPGGFVSIDKPPLGFWIQAASARLLGFSGLSILLPEALAGVGSVALVYVLVRRAFGQGAGLLAALMLAITPVSVAVSRSNTIDSLLVFTLLLAAWTAVKAAETGRLRWLLLTALIVGLGFEIKMLEAYLVVPALGLLYLLAAPRSWLVRAGHLALACVVLVATSFAWPVAVDLTPASQRPWVDSTQDNSAVDLALGYNGIQRLLGRGATLSLASVESAVAPGGGAAAGVPSGVGPGGRQENGTPGPLRLINQQLGGQASWLLTLSAAGLVMSGLVAWHARRRLSTSRQGQAFLLWGTWLLTASAFFSVAEYFHSYYLVTLGPPVAALAAIGTVQSWRAFRAGGRMRRRLEVRQDIEASVGVPVASAQSESLSASAWEDTGVSADLLAWVLPIAVIAGGVLEAHLLSPYADAGMIGWLSPEALGGAAMSAAILVSMLVVRRVGQVPRQVFSSIAASAAALGVVALLVAPGAWAAMPAAGQGGGMLPSGGPGFGRGFGAGATARPSLVGGGRGGRGAGVAPQPNPTAEGAPAVGVPDRPLAGGPRGGAAGGPGFGGRGGADPALIDYLEANQGSATFLLATTNSNTAAPIILQTGKPVMALGGFLGSDPILSVQQFATDVQSGLVRFVLPGGGFGGRGGDGISAWVQQNCSPVDMGSSGGQLYDCAT
jgi:4-amino-4-deoxy-L-arabinose transferase-like glycosyltransferase